MKRKSHRISSLSAGFTIIELLIALAVMVVIAAIATPSILQAYNSYRLTSAAGSIATLLQRTRFDAIHSNNTVSCLGVQNANGWQLGIDENRDNAINGNEPQAMFPGPITILNAGIAPGPASMGAAYQNAIVPAGAIAFDARGTLNPPTTYVTYIGFQNQPQYGYRAVTVTPMGQVKIWTAQANGVWTAQ